MKPEVLAPISQAVATFAGAIFVLIGIWYREQLESSSRSRNARTQIAAEVRALLDLIELNGYLDGARVIIEKLKAGQFAYLNFSSNRSFISVYEANLQNLGHLGGSASDVVRFYMILLSSLEDKDMIADLGSKIEARGAAAQTAEIKELIRRHEYFLAKLSETVRIGEKICADLHYAGGRSQKFLQKPSETQGRIDRGAVPGGKIKQPAPSAGSSQSTVHLN